jgi:hypothetical protein
MYRQAVGNATATIDYAGVAASGGPSRRAAGHLMAVGSPQSRAPGETLLAEGGDAESVYEVVRGTGNDIKPARVSRRRRVTLERLATWIGFAGAVVLESSVLLLCSEAVSDEFGVGGLALPAAIAIGGLAMLGGGRLVARRGRPAVALRPRLRLVGDNRPQLITETRRGAA